MNILNERFIAIRKALGITQKEMGNALGLSSSGISNIEQGLRNVTKKHLRLLNASFHVSEQWMEQGIGNMFLQTDDSLLSRLAMEYNMDAGQKELMRCFLSLTTEQRAAIVYFVCQAANRIRNHEGEYTDPAFPGLNNDSFSNGTNLPNLEEPELSQDDMEEIEEELSRIRQYKIMERKADYATSHCSNVRKENQQ